MLNLLLADAANPGSSWWIYVVLILLVVAMLVLPTISNNKQKKAFNSMVENLHVGDEIRTIGGIIGKVTKINRKADTQTFMLETGVKGSKTVMEFDIASIGLVIKSVAVKEPAEKKEDVKTEELAAPVVDATEEKVTTEEKPAEVSEVKTEVKAEVKPAKKADKKVKTTKTK